MALQELAGIAWRLHGKADKRIARRTADRERGPAGYLWPGGSTIAPGVVRSFATRNTTRSSFAGSRNGCRLGYHFQYGGVVSKNPGRSTGVTGWKAYTSEMISAVAARGTSQRPWSRGVS